MLSAEMGEGLLLRWTVAESRDAQASSVVAHDEVGLLYMKDFHTQIGSGEIDYSRFG